MSTECLARSNAAAAWRSTLRATDHEKGQAEQSTTPTPPIIDALATIRRLQALHVDYIMLMCLLYVDMNMPNMYFPNHKNQFYSLVESLEGMQDETSRVKAANSRKPALSDFIVSSIKRTQFENLRVDISQVTSMHQIPGYENARKEIRGTQPHLLLGVQGRLVQRIRWC